MATTQETYRLGTRYPRYTTKLNAFNAGMYLTNQVEPEGYVKRMVNYDIDATGSHIKPRKGRQLVQDIDTKISDTSWLGLLIMSDYIYNYAGELDDSGNYIISEPFNVTSTSDIILDQLGHGLIYNKSEDTFLKIKNVDEEVSKIESYFNYEHPLIFDKLMTSYNYRNLYTVVNNEIYAIKNGAPNWELSLKKILLGNVIDSDYNTQYFTKTKELTIKELNPLEAANNGYNMLSNTPYVFSDAPTGSLAILGIMKYKVDDSDMSIPLLSPDLGKPVKLRVYHQYKSANTNIKYTVEMRNLNEYNAEFETVIANGTYTTGENNKWFITVTPKYEYTQIRVTATEGNDTTTTTSFVDSIMCNNELLKSYTLKKINLLNCKGLIGWFGYIGIYGVQEAPDTIFFSDIENPGYFPFPNNAITFDNDILAVHNYLDFLLVITVDSIFLVSIGTNIMTSTVKRVMSNIHIPEADAMNLVVLKDQIFFKDATQFYVLKPNNYTSDATDLKNYVISTAIDNYTKNFTSETVKLLNEVYKKTCQKLTTQYKKDIKIEDFDVIGMRSYIMNEDVHYTYTIFPKYTEDCSSIEVDKYIISSGLIRLNLVYNTLTRAWRIYLVPIGSGNVYEGEETIIMLPETHNMFWRNKTTGEYYEFFIINDINKYPEDSEYAGYNNTYNTLKVIKLTEDSMTDNFTFVTDNDIIKLSEHYDNYTFIDTGIIAIEDVFTKRWREVQFNLLNAEPTMIPFHTSFVLDGIERVHSTHYQLQHITDPEDPEYGKIYVTPSETDNLEIGNLQLHGTSTLAAEAMQDDYWVLDLSQFPELTMVTVRFTLQGRGRHASLKLLSDSLKRYELADINWVYRMMSAR